MQRSDVKMMFLILVLLSALDNLPLGCKGEDYDRGKSNYFLLVDYF